MLRALLWALVRVMGPAVLEWSVQKLLDYLEAEEAAGYEGIKQPPDEPYLWDEPCH